MSELPAETREWLAKTGFTVKDEALWFAALTHGSMGEKRDYERLEFLGDRVLGRRSGARLCWCCTSNLWQ